MRITLEARKQPSRLMTYLSPAIAILMTLIVGMIIFSYMGQGPLEGLYIFFIEPISSLYGLGELGVKSVPLILIAIGLTIGFKAKVWNIGAEGQYVMGAIVGGGVALFFNIQNSFFMLTTMMVGGIIGGMFWAAIPAFLKTRFNTNEILSSLMLTYVAVLFLNYLVNGPYRDPAGYNFPQSAMFGDNALLPILIEGTRLNLGAVITLFIVVAIWFLLSRTIIGFQINVIGHSPQAAKYAGFNEKKLVWFSLLVGGGFAGLAGLMEAAGPVGQIQPTLATGYGFTAIIVAFLGRLHPVGILFAGLLLALTYLGGETAQVEMGLPVALAGVFQGMILFFLLAADVLIQYRIRFIKAHH